MAKDPAGAVDLTDSSQSSLMISSILCNDATNADGIEIGDPTETALLNLASGLGMDPEEVGKSIQEKVKTRLTATEN